MTNLLAELNMLFIPPTSVLLY